MLLEIKFRKFHSRIPENLKVKATPCQFLHNGHYKEHFRLDHDNSLII
jgi:hypothetical protein